VSRRALEIAWIALLVVGLALMVPFEETVTLALGVACLLSFVGLGVFLIAHPSALLATDDDDEEAPPARTTPGQPP
jgi:threonine/homoserine efflux transporter RhtA